MGKEMFINEGSVSTSLNNQAEGKREINCPLPPSINFFPDAFLPEDFQLGKMLAENNTKSITEKRSICDYYTQCCGWATLKSP